MGSNKEKLHVGHRARPPSSVEAPAGRVEHSAGPPATIVDHFWRIFGGRVPANSIVLASIEELDPNTLKNSRGLSVSCKGIPSSAFLFFVDLDPEANWAHDCACVFIASTGETAWCAADWSPHESITLKLQARP
jgi:hypothetical protein